ncbi:MAG: CRISPR-associated endonuclease Cas2 [Halanaerobiales bacterium]|nr:CRISPR-associated endonuclease Cas2 [Halanaerobiales bacterium]
MYVILVYDIPTKTKKGEKILRNTFKISKKYLHHIQNSVFEGKISKAKIKALQNELNQYIRKDKDSVILFKSRNKKWLEKEFWGREEDKTANIF